MSRRVFIIGAPRSGTTLLASLLANTISGPPFEPHFITKYYKKLDDYGDITQLNNFGVEIIACGQTLAFNGYKESELIDGIKVSLSAMSALLTLQKDGYGLINFN